MSAFVIAPSTPLWRARNGHSEQLVTRTRLASQCAFGAGVASELLTVAFAITFEAPTSRMDRGLRAVHRSLSERDVGWQPSHIACRDDRHSPGFRRSRWRAGRGGKG